MLYSLNNFSFFIWLFEPDNVLKVIKNGFAINGNQLRHKWDNIITAQTKHWYLIVVLNQIESL